MLSLPLVALHLLTAAPAAKKDCGTDLDCFIAAARACASAQVRNTVTLDLMGMENKTTTLFRIDGSAGGKCKLVQTIEKAEVHLEGQALKRFKQRNPDVSQADIRKEEAAQNKALQAQVGKATECRFTTKALVEVMTHLRDGQYSTKEWAAGCPQANTLGEPVLRSTQ